MRRDAPHCMAGFELSGGTIGTIDSSDSLVSGGAGAWTADAMVGTGSTTSTSDLAPNTGNLKNITARTVNFNGTTTWSNPSASTGRIRTGSTATLNNNGTWLDQNAFANLISQDFGCTPSTFVNAGSRTKSAVGMTSIDSCEPVEPGDVCFRCVPRFDANAPSRTVARLDDGAGFHRHRPAPAERGRAAFPRGAVARGVSR